MEAEAVQVRSDEPRAPSSPPPALRNLSPQSPLVKRENRTSRSVEDASFSLAAPTQSFVEILMQIQALQTKLLQVYEADVGGQAGEVSKSLKLKFSSKQLAVSKPRKGSISGSNVSSDNEPQMNHQASIASRTSRASRASLSSQQKKLALGLSKSAREQTTADIEELLRQGDVAFQVGIEWALDEDALSDLQRAHVVTSPRAPTTTSGAHRRIRRASEKVKGCAIHPEEPKRIVWDLLAMLALFLEVVTAPLQVYDITGGARQVTEALNWTTTAFWAMDVPASFLTAVYINDILHTKLADVAWAYLRSWFFFDLLMLAPEVLFLINMLSQPEGGEVEDPAASGLLRALRARRLLKVVRFVRLLRFRKAFVLLKKFSCCRYMQVLFNGWISSSLVPILCLMFGLGMAVHFLASLWFVAGTVEHGWAFVEDLHEAPFFQQYVRSVEWAVSRLPASSLRANVELHTVFERWLAILATFVSLIISSLFISVLTNLMANVARRTRKMAQILESVRKYCGACGVSFAHTMKVRRLVEREHFRASIQEHMQFLLTLPEGLVKELFHEARSLTLASHPFFLEIGAANTRMELELCNNATKELYLLDLDEVFHENQKGQGIYFLASGAGRYTQGTQFYEPQSAPEKSAAATMNRIFFSVVNGAQGETGGSPQEDAERVQVPVQVEEYLSEQALWVRGWKHQGRLEATVESRALCVHTADMHAVLEDHSDARAVAVVYARSFVDAMNRLSPDQISDLSLEPEQLSADPQKSGSHVISEMRQRRLDRVEPGFGD